MKLTKLTIFIFVFLVSLSSFDVAKGATESIKTIKPSGQGGDYTTLAAWEAGEQKNLVSADQIAVAQIAGNWSTPDTTAVTIDGWTTDATRYIRIYTTPEARHSGKWNTEKYILSVSAGWSQPLGINEQYVRVDGLQIENTEVKTNDPRGIYSYALDTTSSNLRISNNIIRLSGTGTPGTNARGILAETGLNMYIWNNIIYDGGRGIEISWFNLAVDVVIYNNSLVDNVVAGIEAQLASANNFRVYNNLVQGSTTGYSINWMDSTGNNISEDATSPDTALRSKVVIFADEAGDDFHLGASDSFAKNGGADLTSDASLSFNTDIDGQSRPTGTGTWDIGADEFMGATLQSPEQKENSIKSGLVLYQSFDGKDMSGGMVASDNFDRANSNPIGGNWTTATGCIAIKDISNGVAGVNTYAGNCAYWNANSFNNDQYSQIKVLDTAGFPGVILRHGTNYYAAGVTSATRINIWRYDAGAFTNLATINTAVAVNDIFKADVVGTVITVYINGVPVGNYDDTGSSIVSGPPGVYVYGILASAPDLDDWEGGNTTVALDKSGVNNNGNVSGATPTMGKKGQALSFNGTSDFVNNGNVGTGIKTISFWVKANDLTSKKVIDFDGTDQIEIDGSSNILATSFPDTTIVYVDGVASSILTSGWHFVTITDTTGVNGSAVTLGKVSSSYFDGALDEVRFYDRALSADEVGDLYRLGEQKVSMSLTNKNTSGLVGMWSFDGGDLYGGTAFDRSGLSNNGRVYNASPTAGKNGQALYFSGAGSYVRISDDAEIEGLNQLTVSAWVKSDVPNKALGGNSILEDYSSSSFMFDWDQGENIDFTVYNNAAGFAVGTYTDGILDTNWHHVVGVYNGSDIRVYVDNVLGDVVTPWSDPVRATSSNFDISSSANPWNGKIDEVRVYNRALSADEVGDLYRLGQVKIKR
jgi:hypothetical protein